MAKPFLRPWVGMVISAAAFGASWHIDQGRPALGAGGFGLMAGCVAVILFSRQLLPGLLVPQVIAAIFALQGFWISLNAVLAGSTVIPGMMYKLDVSGFALQATAPLLLVPLGSLMGAGALRLVGGGKIRRSFLDFDQGRVTGALFSFYLLMAVAVSIAYWPATLSEQGFGAAYMIRVLQASLVFVPVLAGKYTVGRKWITFVWYAGFLINAIVAILAGTRSVAFVPPALFVAGRILGTSGIARRRWIVTTLWAAAPALLISGLTGLIRDRIGRGTELVNSERPEAMYEITENVVEDLDGSEESFVPLKTASIGRMVVPTNAAVAIMTPSIIPFRGFDTFLREIESYGSISVLADQSVDDFLAAGLATSPANDYGFTVNAATSVEFSIFADAWSRGGAWACVVFGFVACLILGAIEAAVHMLRTIWPSSAMLLFCVLADGAQSLNTYPLLQALRRTILGVALLLGLALVCETIAHAVAVRSQRKGLAGRFQASAITLRRAEGE